MFTRTNQKSEKYKASMNELVSRHLECECEWFDRERGTVLSAGDFPGVYFASPGGTCLLCLHENLTSLNIPPTLSTHEYSLIEETSILPGRSHGSFRKKTILSRRFTLIHVLKELQSVIACKIKKTYETVKLKRLINTSSGSVPVGYTVETSTFNVRALQECNRGTGLETCFIVKSENVCQTLCSMKSNPLRYSL